MSKKRSWVGLIKRIFFLEPHHQQHQQKITRRRKWLFGRLKRTKTLPSPSTLTSSSQQTSVQLTKHDHHEQKQSICENEDVLHEQKQNNCKDDDVLNEQKQSKCDDVDDDVVNEQKQSTCEDNDDDDDVQNFEFEEKLLNSSESTTNEANMSMLNSEYESTQIHNTHAQNLAAIKIQTAYRGFLAKKALRALKGFVRLQAIIRGRAVRRQAMTTLKCLQSIAKIQSQVCARRCQMTRGKDADMLMLQHLKNQNPKIQLCRLRRLDDELLSKEEEIDIILKKKEAILRSKKIKAYSFNHRHSADAILDGNSQGRLRYWLEQYVSNEAVPKKEDVTSTPRRSFHKHWKQNSYGDHQDSLHPSSPTNLPTYMAATESAKARTRSTSSPRLRPIHIDAYSDNDSPYKQKFSPMSSINSEATCSAFSKISIKSSFSSSNQKSPSFKGVSGPIRSNKYLK